MADERTTGELRAVAGEPAAVDAWFDRQNEEAIRQLAMTEPELVGGVEGAPYWARDLANRRILDASLADARSGTRRADDLRALRSVLDTVPDSSLPMLDLQDPDRVYAAIALGDLDTAASVTYLVPGIANTVGDDMARFTESAMNVRDEVALWGSGDAADVATVAWMGYDPGHVHTVASDELANAGAERLERTLDGFTAVRPDPTVELGILGHSYGATTAAAALSDGDQHGVDRFVSLASAGFEPTGDMNGWWPGGKTISPSDFGSTKVFVTESSSDVTADIGRWMSGRVDPAHHGFTTFSSDARGGRPGASGHHIASRGAEVGYLGPGSNSLYNIGRILNGLAS